MELWYTFEDVQLEFGKELPLVDDGTGQDVIDVNLIETALRDTQNLIMTYLRKMKTFKEDPSPLVILELKSSYLNIARYRFTNKSNELTDMIVERYKAEIEYLREVSAGKVLLGETATKVGLINRRLQRG